MKKFLLFLFFFNIVLAGIGYFLPTAYSVNRSIAISASPSQIHKYVGDLKHWQEWTPWKGNDGNVVITIGEKTTGIGATQSWQDQHGGGSLIFTSWSPSEGIEYDLFFEGGRYTSKSTINYAESSNSNTKVTWTLKGDTQTPILGGYFALIFKYGIEDMFDEGLSQLKIVSEQEYTK